jgi:hypothetical protein
VDPFSLFHLRWIKPVRNRRLDSHYWRNQCSKPAYQSWTGYAFESVCWLHVGQLRAALQVPVGSLASSWRFIPRKHMENGAQIDLLFDRPDDAVTVCEIKFTDAPFRIDKSYAKNLLNKVEVFKSRTGTQKQVFIALISAAGLQESLYSEELISARATADDLFKESEL